MINFIKGTDYLHIYYVPGLNDKLKVYKDVLIKEFFERRENKQEVNANIITSNLDFQNECEKDFYKIVEEYYLVDSNWNFQNFGIYVQTKENFRDVFHHHQRQSTIIATTYIDPFEEEEGGELELWNVHEDPIKIVPLKDHIYFFPAWLPHRPLPHKVDKTRVCLNWGYNCAKRPIHKITGDRW